MAWSFSDLSGAVSYITGKSKETLQQTKELAIWTWNVIQGDFKQDQDVSHVVANTAVSIGVTLTGVGVLVAWLMDLRDLVANATHIYQAGTNTKDSKFDIGKVSPMLWIALIATLVGVIPALGDLAKGVFRIILIFFKRAAKNTKLTSVSKLMAKAVDDAMPHIRQLLGHPTVQKWLKKRNWHRPFRELAKCFKIVKPKVTKANIMAKFDECVKGLKEIINSIKPYLPSGATKKIDALYETLSQVRKGLNDAVAKHLKPFQDSLDEIIIRLEKEDYVAFTARTGKINEHYFGRVAVGSKAWQQARHGGYLVKSKIAPFKFTTLGDNADEIAWATKQRNWPTISSDDIETFHKIAAKEIKGPAKLYRVVDPESWPNGKFWMTEEDFAKLTSRTEWRSKCAVKEEWNANGQFVVYEVKKGETLKVWSGPAASQLYEGDLWYKGGGNQIVFSPSADRVSARKATGWGYLDRDEHLLNERIIVDLSGKKQ